MAKAVFSFLFVIAASMNLVDTPVNPVDASLTRSDASAYLVDTSACAVDTPFKRIDVHSTAIASTPSDKASLIFPVDTFLRGIARRLPAVDAGTKRIDSVSTVSDKLPNVSASFLSGVAQDAAVFDRVVRERIASAAVFAQEAAIIAVQ